MGSLERSASPNLFAYLIKSSGLWVAVRLASEVVVLILKRDLGCMILDFGSQICKRGRSSISDDDDGFTALV